MVTSHFDTDRGIGRIVLRPNRPWSWRANLGLVGSLMLVSGSIGLAYAVLGYWVILPVTALELAVLTACLYWCVHRAHRQEVLTFSPDHLTIEKGRDRPTECYRYDRFFTRIHVDEPPHPWYRRRIAVRSRDTQVEIGTFLGQAETDQLVRLLRQMVNRF